MAAIHAYLADTSNENNRLEGIQNCLNISLIFDQISYFLVKLGSSIYWNSDWSYHRQFTYPLHWPSSFSLLPGALPASLILLLGLVHHA